MQRYYCLLVFGFLASMSLNSQDLMDDFSDGNFSDNPSWQGDGSQFVVNSEELQLNADMASGTDGFYLSTPATTMGQTTWEFYVRQESAPSTSNYMNFYLSSDNPNLTEEVFGYLIRIGGESGSLDALQFRRQDGITQEILIEGGQGEVGTNPVEVRVRVVRSIDNLWTLETDYTGGNNFMIEGAVSDETYPFGAYIGWNCHNTISFSQAFYLDDVLVDPLFEDNVPPEATSLNALNETSIEVTFNEDIQNFSVENFEITPSIEITDASVTTDDNKVILTLADPLQNFIEYMLTVQGVEDLAGNQSIQQVLEFEYFQLQSAEAGELKINEIMPSPNSSSLLPNAEYIEIINVSDKIIDLTQIMYRNDNGSYPLLLGILSPGELTILTEDEDANMFQSFGAVTSIASSMGINNTGENISLLNTEGILIDSVSYIEDWYGEENSLGVALERLSTDLDSNCDGNWQGATNVLLGTPSSENSRNESHLSTIPPQLVNIATVDSETIFLYFDAALSSNIEISNEDVLISSNIEVLNVSLNPVNSTILIINTTELSIGEIYNLTVNPNTIKDCLGNTVDIPINGTIGLTLLPQPGQILFNELMIDPNPVQLLPEAEYIELFNSSTNLLNLADLKLIREVTEVNLPNYLLEPNQYVILCDPDDFISLQNTTENAVIVTNLPSLVNTGALLQLFNTNDILIDHVDYQFTWLDEPNKLDGGWSLERISPDQSSDCDANWTASVDPKGGTPGQVNSTHQNLNDNQGPKLFGAFPLSGTELLLTFDEAIDFDANLISNISILPQTIIYTLDIYDRYGSQLILDIDPLQEGQIYTLSIDANNIFDCISNPQIQTQIASFGLASTPEEQDLIINEILFNPLVGGVDYIELYNNSDKIINLNELSLNNPKDTTFSSIRNIDIKRQFLPQTFITLTPNTIITQRDYNVPNPQWLLTQNIPSLPNDQGNVSLQYGELILDQVYYEEDYHYQLLRDEDGVSLERLNYNKPSMQASNWHSAAETIGYGTPTYQNSQYFEEISENTKTDGTFTFQNLRVSPDEDGFEDLIVIDYQFDTPGHTANIKIFDDRGRQIKELLNNTLLGQQGSIKWDGSTDSNSRSKIGIYIVHIEYFTPHGQVNQQKQAVVVALPLN